MSNTIWRLVDSKDNAVGVNLTDEELVLIGLLLGASQNGSHQHIVTKLATLIDIAKANVAAMHRWENEGGAAHPNGAA